MTPSCSPQRPPSTGAALIAGACLAVLSGCTTVAPDGGFGPVAAGARARIGAEPRIARDDASARELAATVGAMLTQPLDMDAAVRVALLNSPALQATYWDVGLAQADLAQAGRLQNPSFDFKHTGAGGSLEVERTLTFNLVGTLLMPLAARLEARRFEGVKRDVGARIERYALDTRFAWVEAVAAAHSLEYARQVDEAAAASAELADRTARAGSMNQLDLARERVFYAETSAELARAGRRAVAAREALTRLLGLWGKDARYTLPAHLPELPAAPSELQYVERLALEGRLDVQAAKLDAATTAANLGLTRVTRVINVLNLSAVNRTDTGAPTAHGYELNVAVPLFDWGGARVAKAQAQYMQAVSRVQEAAVTARSEARAGYLDYRTAYDVARHYRDTIIPLRKRISQEVLLRYNGMQVGAADLLADSRDQATAVSAYIDALKEFWRAHVALEGALGMRVAHPAHAGQPQEHAE
jgi:hypothetical protein